MSAAIGSLAAVLFIAACFAVTVVLTHRRAREAEARLAALRPAGLEVSIGYYDAEQRSIRADNGELRWALPRPSELEGHGPDGGHEYVEGLELTSMRQGDHLSMPPSASSSSWRRPHLHALPFLALLLAGCEASSTVGNLGFAAAAFAVGAALGTGWARLSRGSSSLPALALLALGLAGCEASEGVSAAALVISVVALGLAASARRMRSVVNALENDFLGKLESLENGLEVQADIRTKLEAVLKRRPRARLAGEQEDGTFLRIGPARRVDPDTASSLVEQAMRLPPEPVLEDDTGAFEPYEGALPPPYEGGLDTSVARRGLSEKEVAAFRQAVIGPAVPEIGELPAGVPISGITPQQVRETLLEQYAHHFDKPGSGLVGEVKVTGDVVSCDITVPIHGDPPLHPSAQPGGTKVEDLDWRGVSRDGLSRGKLLALPLLATLTACGPDIIGDPTGDGDGDAGSETEAPADLPGDGDGDGDPTACVPGTMYCTCSDEDLNEDGDVPPGGECFDELECDAVANVCIEAAPDCVRRGLAENVCQVDACQVRWEGTELWSRAWDAVEINGLADVDPSSVWPCEPDPDVEVCKVVDDLDHVGCFRFYGETAVAVAPTCEQDGWLDVGCGMSAATSNCHDGELNCACDNSTCDPGLVCVESDNGTADICAPTGFGDPCDHLTGLDLPGAMVGTGCVASCTQGDSCEWMECSPIDAFAEGFCAWPIDG